jgi:hypothetical protein
MNIDAALYNSRRNYRIAVSSLFFLSGLCFSSWASRIPSIQKELGLSAAALLVLLFYMHVRCHLLASRRNRGN